MKKKFLVGTIRIGLLLAVVFGIYHIKLSYADADQPQINANLPQKIVDIDKIVRHPERFKGPVGVVGKVIKVNESKAFFILGCKDACVRMPVSYRGQMPDQGSEIIVYGEIKEEGGRYIFEGQVVKAK